MSDQGRTVLHSETLDRPQRPFLTRYADEIGLYLAAKNSAQVCGS